MQDAVTEAVQAAVDEGMKFDVRANLYTIIAITGQIASMNFLWLPLAHVFQSSWRESCITRIVHSQIPTA